MKLNALILICILNIAGCKENTPNLLSIDFLDYNWSVWDAKTDQSVPAFFKCRRYAHIDNSGKVLLFVYGNIHPPILHNYTGKIGQDLIQEIKSLAKKFEIKEIDSIYNQKFPKPDSPNYIRYIYDGTYLKIRVNFDNGQSKMFYLIGGEDFSDVYPQLLKLDNQLHTIFLNPDTSFIDKEGFDKIKFNFLRDAAISDTSSLERIVIPIRVLKNDTIVNISDLTKY